jgi:hypothetical protein
MFVQFCGIWPTFPGCGLPCLVGRSVCSISINDNFLNILTLMVNSWEILLLEQTWLALVLHSSKSSYEASSIPIALLNEQDIVCTIEL